MLELYAAIEAFMPDNAIACLAAMACCIMGAAYEEVIKHCGHTGVPFLVGEPGSCKTNALLCALSLFGADHTLQQADNTIIPVQYLQTYNHTIGSR